MASVEAAALTRRFGAATALENADLKVEDGEFVVIVGPSGCGKSTLLRLIAGLEEPSGGRVRIGEVDVTDLPPAERGVAMVFQSYALYPHLTVAENIAFPLRVAKLPKAQIAARVAELAEMLDLTDLLGRRPRALSGGQRQRVSIGRALARNPAVLLLDEPLSNLDSGLRVRMRHTFARLHQQLGATMIYVTHDQIEAMTLANRIVVMEGGRIEQIGAPLELYRRPASLAVARAIGSPAMNLLPGMVTGAHAVQLDGNGEVAIAGTIPAELHGTPVTLGARPEDLQPDPAGPFGGPVELFERLGPLSFVHLGSDGAQPTLVAQLPGDTAVTLGDTLRFSLPADKAHLFGPNGRALSP